MGFFKINLIVYELEGRVAKLFQRSREIYSETMRLNIWENHLSLIVDFEHYCSVYQCIHYRKPWDRNCHYCRVVCSTIWFYLNFNFFLKNEATCSMLLLFTRPLPRDGDILVASLE